MTVYENYIEFAKKESYSQRGSDYCAHAKKIVEEAEKLKAGTITEDQYRANTTYYEDMDVDLKYAASDFHKRQGINYLRDKIVDWYPN